MAAVRACAATGNASHQHCCVDRHVGLVRDPCRRRLGRSCLHGGGRFRWRGAWQENPVFFGDHKHKVDVASGLANRWFTEDHVGAIVDMPNSTVALAVQKLAAERDKISITVSGGSSDLTGKDCRQTGFHWAYDTYSNTVGMARALVGFGLDTWYFITADYAFGWSMEENASSAVKAAGGRVIGRSRHPLDTSNFGEFLTAAQDSGAKIIALANAGGDTINSVKQAAEIGISPRSQTLVPLWCSFRMCTALGLMSPRG